jgi:hypothetical protein
MEFDFESSIDKKKLQESLSEEILKEDADGPKDRVKDIVKFIIKSSKDRKLGGTEHDTLFVLDTAKENAESLLLENKNINVWIEAVQNDQVVNKYLFENFGWSAMSGNRAINKGHATYLAEELNYSEDHQTMLQRYLDHCAEFLGLEELPEIHLIYKRDEDMTTGAYDPQNYQIRALAGGRAFADVLRTIAHELVHHKQNLQNRLVGEIPVVGGEIEDEANAVGGQMIKSFGTQEDNDLIYEL